MKRMPFLLLMPSYNQAQYIVEAVRSVIAQDDPDWELWILDNSTDNTASVMQQFSDPRIRFHHIPQRMDPGSCLNWLLERSSGQEFSYVHTDNNLRSDYVRRMREALSGHSLALAFCDMRIIRGDGAPRKLKRRGPVDLPRIVSLDVLGVPFAATTELAKAVGGFKAGDFADDARFCVSSYGIAEFVYVRQALLDYRVHAQSRSVQEGGMDRALQGFLKMLLETVPLLQQRGLDPLDALRRAVIDRFEELEWFVEDLWYRRLSRVARPWWQQGAPATHLFHAGLLHLQGFSSRWRKPRLRLLQRGEQGIAAWPWNTALMAAYLAMRTPELRRLTERIEHVLLPWAYLTQGGHLPRFALADPGFRTVAGALLLDSQLHWQAAIPAALEPALRWTGFPLADGKEATLRIASEPAMEAPT